MMDGFAFEPSFPGSRGRIEEEGDGLAKSFDDLVLSLRGESAHLWARALEQALVLRFFDAQRHNRTFNDWDTLADALLVFGLNWTPSNEIPARVLRLSSLMERVDELSFDAQVTLALAALLRPAEATAELRGLTAKVRATVLDSMHVQGRTAYLKRARGVSHAADWKTQAYALEVLALSGATHPFVEKLANYLRAGEGQRRGRSFIYSFGYESQALAALALADYDEARNSLSPDLKLQAKSGSKTVLAAEFRDAGAPQAEAAVSLASLPRRKGGAPRDVQFSATGTGEVSVAAVMRFVPSMLSPDPIYRGLFVERVVQPDREGADVVAVGDFVTVTVQVTTPDDLGYVELADWLPAGLEAQKPVAEPITPFGFGFGAWWRWMSAFDSPELHADRVTWRAHYLRAGSHSVSYRALAVTPGIFVHPPAKASVASQPELMGLSGAGAFVVLKEPLPPAEAAAFLAANKVPAPGKVVPKTCPRCARDEICNLRTGECQKEEAAPVFQLRAASIVYPGSSAKVVAPPAGCQSVPKTFKVRSNCNLKKLGFVLRAGKCVRVTSCPEDRVANKKRVAKAGGKLFATRKACMQHKNSCQATV